MEVSMPKLVIFFFFAIVVAFAAVALKPADSGWAKEKTSGGGIQPGKKKSDFVSGADYSGRTQAMKRVESAPRQPQGPALKGGNRR
jgi:hypothetical protein